MDYYELSFTPFDYFKNNGNRLWIDFPKGSLILIDASDVPTCYLSAGATT